jgi:hypothetical protein
VLSDVLARWDTNGELDRITTDNPAARRVLWDLVSSFEPVVDVAPSPDYDEHVRRAQAAVLAE